MVPGIFDWTSSFTSRLRRWRCSFERLMKANFKMSVFFLLLLTGMVPAQAQSRPLSQSMAHTVMTLWKDSVGTETGKAEKWNYEQGVVLKGMQAVWYSTGEGRYFKYIQHNMDRFVSDDGNIKTYKLEDYNIDNVLNGRILLLLYKVTGQDKYRKAAALLREQLKTQSRTADGGFWHKKIYPQQMWLDGLYMGEPFYAEYAETFHEDADFDDIATQFMLMEGHARDPQTGLLYHAWDQTRQQRWANPRTGQSPNFWGRAVGWYAMALVDTLDYFPKDHPKREMLIAIMKRLAIAIGKYQDSKSGLWYEVLDKSGAPGNYLEASASCMFVYALAKGVREGYLPNSYLKTAQKAYQGITDHFIEAEANGEVNLKGPVSVGGLGGTPYRDGSYEYYLSEKVLTNDPKGIGTFLLASNEIEVGRKLSTKR